MLSDEGVWDYGKAKVAIVEGVGVELSFSDFDRQQCISTVKLNSNSVVYAFLFSNIEILF